MLGLSFLVLIMHSPPFLWQSLETRLASNSWSPFHESRNYRYDILAYDKSPTYLLNARCPFTKASYKVNLTNENLQGSVVEVYHSMLKSQVPQHLELYCHLLYYSYKSQALLSLKIPETVQDQLGLYSAFQDSQDYVVRPCWQIIKQVCQNIFLSNM